MEKWILVLGVLNTGAVIGRGGDGGPPTSSSKQEEQGGKGDRDGRLEYICFKILL